MLAALACFGVRLQAETHLAQQASNNLMSQLQNWVGAVNYWVLRADF
jgi:hypothetical protein